MVRVIVELDSGDWHGHASERLWAEPVEGSDVSTAFRLVNSPFFARGMSYRDIVIASPTASDGGLVVERVLEHGGHSTYMILADPNSQRFEEYWNELAALGCTYEGTGTEMTFGGRALYSVDVPPEADVYAAYSILERTEMNGVWGFQEGHVGHPLKSQV